MKLATWNVNSVRSRIDHLRRWVSQQQPDLVALQETKAQDADFPQAELADLGYALTINGQKSYNGVAVLSRAPATRVDTSIPGFDDPQRRVLGLELSGGYFLNVYVPNGAEVGSEKYAYKLAWLDALTAWLTDLTRRFDRVVVLGDFNIAPDDRDVHDPELWRGAIMCSAAERTRLASLEALGLRDAFRYFTQPAAEFSWWDYRGGAFRRNQGLRIDLILASAALAGRCSSCFIDREPRTWEKPSDHAPVVATIDG